MSTSLPSPHITGPASARPMPTGLIDPTNTYRAQARSWQLNYRFGLNSISGTPETTPLREKGGQLILQFEQRSKQQPVVEGVVDSTGQAPPSNEKATSDSSSYCLEAFLTPVPVRASQISPWWPATGRQSRSGAAGHGPSRAHQDRSSRGRGRQRLVGAPERPASAPSDGSSHARDHARPSTFSTVISIATRSGFSRAGR